jgi:hypothetical protein
MPREEYSPMACVGWLVSSSEAIKLL